LRLQDFVYIVYPGTHERELYDLRVDPLQLQNVSGDPDFFTEIELLDTWLEDLSSCARAGCRAIEDAAPNGTHRGP
jgi:hypothetical protein